MALVSMRQFKCDKETGLRNFSLYMSGDPIFDLIKGNAEEFSSKKYSPAQRFRAEAGKNYSQKMAKGAVLSPAFARLLELGRFLFTGPSK